MAPDYDIAIVGYGPVGQTAAILLGRRGWRVGVFERWPELYPRPRAVHYDDEVARVFQRIGISQELEAITEPATTYEWQNAAGQTLLVLDQRKPGPSGWPASTMFSQPELERLLDSTAKEVHTVEVRQGWEVADVEDTGEEVRLSLRRGQARGGGFEPTGETEEVTASYVIGCDGANSLVRERMGTPVEDLGFAFDWLIADTVPRDPGLLAGVNLQRCDPRRPTTLVSGGPGRRRWEWMLLPGETPEQVENERFVMERLASPASAPTRSSSSASRSTPSARAGPSAGARAGCCSPATRRTRCRRSPGRACARGSATRWRSTGGSTSCCALARTSRRSTPTPASAARTSSTRSPSRSSSAR